MTDENPTPEAASEKPTETPDQPEAVAVEETPTDSTAPEVETPAPEPELLEPATEPRYGYWWGTGRRKTAVARVRIRTGEGKFVVNKKEIDDFFRLSRDRQDVIAPLEATSSRKHIDVFVNVRGGGTTGQAGAIVLGVARALCKFNPQYMQTLRDGRFLTRDSREVERKKYGQRGARRRFQFSNR